MLELDNASIDRIGFVLMLFPMLSYVLITFVSTILNKMWHHDLYCPLMMLFSVARWGTSFAQVMAVKSNEGGKAKSKKVVPATQASMAESAAAESGLASTAGGGPGGGPGGADTAASTTSSSMARRSTLEKSGTANSTGITTAKSSGISSSATSSAMSEI
jgi:hypothetical protein